MLIPILDGGGHEIGLDGIDFNDFDCKSQRACLMDRSFIFPEDPSLWMETWEKYQEELTDRSAIYIQTLCHGDLGGI